MEYVGFGCDEFVGHFGNLRRDLQRYAAHAVAITVEKIARSDWHTANAYRCSDIHNLRVAMGADGRGAEHGKIESSHLCQVASGARSNNADCAECLIGAAHYLAEGGGNRRVIEVLKDDDRGSGKVFELSQLRVQRVVGARTAAERAPHGGSCRETNHGRHFWKRGANSGIHVASVSRTHFEQLDYIADSWRVKLGQLAKCISGYLHGCQFIVLELECCLWYLSTTNFLLLPGDVRQRSRAS